MNNNKNFFRYHPESSPYHLVHPSPWPVYLSISLLPFLNLIVINFYPFNFFSSELNFLVMFYFIIIISQVLFYWFEDIITEATFQGAHPKKVQKNLRFGAILFIISEIMFFFGFFWSYFHSALVPSIWTGDSWPPKGLEIIDPFSLPFFNTLLLLSSGISVTWAHRALVAGNLRRDFILSLSITIFYGILFTAFQLFEYNVSPFSICDSVYGSLFFLLTGFHGLHVFIGTLMLFVSLNRYINYHFGSQHHIGFEFAVWYWHFVDVVWIFLYIFLYVMISY